MSLRISQTTLNELAAECGLAVMAIGSPSAMPEDQERLNKWQLAGHSAEMGYMRRDSTRLSDPLTLLPEARSVVSFAIHYDRTERPELPLGHGRVARYAWGLDYHQVLKAKISALCSLVEAKIGERIRWRGFSDAVPLLERALARRAGLGFVGKSTMLIRPGEGTFFFLAEVLWNIEIDQPKLQIIDGECGTCKSCIDKCPTGAIVSEREVDARRCISYLTIEKRGRLEPAERAMLGQWVFGCDVCQDVCPFNHSALKQTRVSALEEFSKDRGVGPMINLEFLFGLNQGTFKRVFADTALLRPGRAGLIRNGLAVAANTRAVQLTEAIEHLAINDPDGVVRSHALWALVELVRQCNMKSADWLNNLLNQALLDSDPVVVSEARQLAGQSPMAFS